MAAIRPSRKSTSIKNSNQVQSVVFIKPPPADAVVPSVPHGFVAITGSAFRGVMPKTAQLAVVADVVTELQRFADYVEVFGKTSPPLPSVLQTFDAASQWSAMRAKNAAWDLYCRTQEGTAWRDVRKYADRMQPAFELAVAGDASVGARYPALARFFASGKASAQKALVTKRANQKLVEEGKMPFKGGVGRRRKKTAADEALQEKEAAKAAPHPPASVTNGAAAPAAPAPTVNVTGVGSA